MTRPTMAETLTEVAQAWAKRSTCTRLNVGAVIHTANGVVLSSGYNGALAGMEHCKHMCDCAVYVFGPMYAGKHEEGCTASKPCAVTMHAEANTIVWAARRGVATEGQHMTSTHAPCFRCAQLIIQAGIVSVRFGIVYRDKAGTGLLREAGVTLL